MIAVMGAGAFGTSLAISLSAVQDVLLVARDAAHADEMRKTGQNTRRLAGVSLPQRITCADRLATEALTAELTAVLLAIPTQRLRQFCAGLEAPMPSGVPLVACCKGIELGTGKRPSEVLEEHFPNAPVATLTGPSFAADIARGLPTALTLACADGPLAAALQAQLTTPNVRVYRTTDLIGAELGGALKNVIAIACGAAIGAGLGDSARAALMTRGFAEMVRVAQALGADPVTLSGLSGFGDLVLTCSSEQSRNYQAGLALGRGAALPENLTIEGVATADAMCGMAAAQGLDLPITRAVSALASGELQVSDAMDMLLSRPLKEETC
ncbi:MAG: NAD(P)H-dependent glycerol-3-phosphate dehydrogenase [Pseudomonadota bacterium]